MQQSSSAKAQFKMFMMTSSYGNNFRIMGPLCGEFTGQRPVTRSFDVFFDLRLNKRLNKQSWGWWFETPSRSLWRHCNISEKSDHLVLTSIRYTGGTNTTRRHHDHSLFSVFVFNMIWYSVRRLWWHHNQRCHQWRFQMASLLKNWSYDVVMTSKFISTSCYYYMRRGLRKLR